jgi:exportin-7
MVCTGCCTTLDHIVSFLFKQLTQKGEFQVYRSSFLDSHLFSGKKSRRGSINSREGEVFLQVLEQHPEILQQILSTVLNIIMFEDCRNQWSMSRPLLGLILLNEDVNKSTPGFVVDF